MRTDKERPEENTCRIVKGLEIRYNKLRKLKIAEKVDTACRSLVE